MASGQKQTERSAGKRTQRVTVHVDEATAQALQRAIERRRKECGRGARITASSYVEDVLQEHLATCR